MIGLLDTSVVLGARPTDLPHEAAISVITMAELRLGVLVAPSATERAARLELVTQLERLYSPIPVDDDVARAYAAIVAAERDRGRRPRAMDVLVAATALTHDLTLYTRDEGLAKIGSIKVRLVR
jgi:predicted nucleic acid-binding protein